MAVLGEVSLATMEYLCLLLSLCGCILLKIDHEQPKPYMDEIFHIPQAQKYCEGNFQEWDPMITTLPGLYLVSVGVMRPMAWLLELPMKTMCSTFWLRSINIPFTIGNVVLLRLLLRKLHGKHKSYTEAGSLLGAMAMGLLPVLQFFTFLYYTDPGAVYCVLLMYLLSLHGNHVTAALAGVVAVLFRQTNIVWVVFVAGVSIIDTLTELVQPEKKDIPAEHQQNPTFLLTVLKQIWINTKNNWRTTITLFLDLLKILWPYLLIVSGFMAFVILNGSIVVGAKDDHQVGLHVPQLFYFCSFTTASCFMYHITLPKLKNFLKFLWKHPFLVIIFCVLSALAIWKLTFAHRYLLSDNRHYPFYIWSKLYSRHELVRYALVPCYLFGVWTLCDSLQEQSGLWKLVYWVCVTVNLVPQLLLEFRYFILPYLIFRLHMKPPSYIQLVLEIVFSLMMNAATLYMFVEKPFKWADSAELQRFMW